MQGRCAAPDCGAEGSYKAMLAHVGRCPKFAELYRTDPEKALDPAEEYRRVAADRKVAPVAAKSRIRSPEVTESPATVSSSKESPRRVRRSAPVEEPVREPGPVVVEHWVVPRGLLDASTS